MIEVRALPSHHITVVGSYVVDLMCHTPQMPKIGETLLGGPFRMGAGGKGGNQATAAVRLGAKVTFVTKVGNDDFGRTAIEHFTKENMIIDKVATDEAEMTGVALILVDNRHDNQIVVSLGACGNLNRQDVSNAEPNIARSDIVLVQLETNLEAVETTILLASRHHVPIIMNPAPYQEFNRQWLQEISFLTPNESEASALTGIEVTDRDTAHHAACRIAEWGVRNAIVTLGGKGALLKIKDGPSYWFPPYRVDVKDTTGAGDAFNGGLARALSKGMDVTNAVQYASAVAALSVTEVGTAVSMPREDQVIRLMESQRGEVVPVQVLE
jgi:ribokinase